MKEGVSPSEKRFMTKTSIICGTCTPATAAKEHLKKAHRKESGLPESKRPMMCFTGRLDAHKGYDLLLEALVEDSKDTEVQLLVVGAGRPTTSAGSARGREIRLRHIGPQKRFPDRPREGPLQN